MTEAEFVKVMAYLSAGFGGREIPTATLDVYWDLLQDLPGNIAFAAIKKVLVENIYPTFPAVGVIRKAAVDLANPQMLLPAEAWGLVQKANDKFGYYRAVEGMESLPVTVQKAVRAMGGFTSICMSENPDITRGQFMKMYDQYAARERELATIPASVRELIGETVKSLPER